MSENPQYDYDYEEVLAPLHARAKWPDQPVQICPPVGWVDLVLNLNSDLSRVFPDYVIVQVKEKFAELRYTIDWQALAREDSPHYEMAKEIALDLINEAYAASKTMCQICGEEGRVHDERVWCATLCDEHVNSSRWGS